MQLRDTNNIGEINCLARIAWSPNASSAPEEAQTIAPAIQILPIVNEEVREGNWTELATMADLAVTSQAVDDPEVPSCQRSSQGHKAIPT